MKRNILYTGLIAATTLLTLGSCYDLDEMNRDPYGVEDTDKGGEITPEEPTDSKYANINLNYRVSKEDSAAYKKQLADAPAKFRKFLYEGYYNDYQRTTNLSHDIYAGYVANNQPKHAGKAPDYNYTDGWSALRWSFFYNDRSSEYRDLVRAYKFNDTPEKYRNMFYITRIYYAFLALANTDTYGDMPFTEYVQAKVPETNNVAYNTQEEVYDAMFLMLEQAVDSIKPDDASQYKIDKDDICYFGDANKWLRFANTLRLRMALRISNVAPERAKKEAEAALNNKYGLMTSNADNMQTVPRHAPVEMGGEDSGGDENGLAMCSVAYGGESVLSKDMEDFYRNLSDGGKDYIIKKGRKEEITKQIDPRCLVCWYRSNMTSSTLAEGKDALRNDFVGCERGAQAPQISMDPLKYSLTRTVRMVLQRICPTITGSTTLVRRYGSAMLSRSSSRLRLRCAVGQVPTSQWVLSSTSVLALRRRWTTITSLRRMPTSISTASRLSMTAHSRVATASASSRLSSLRSGWLCSRMATRVGLTSVAPTIRLCALS